MLIMDGKQVFCLECANLGHDRGCTVCGMIKSKNRRQFEREQAYKVWWNQLSKAEQIEIKNKRKAVQQLATEATAVKDRADALDDFLKRIWEGLSKFQMDSCGIPELDEKVRAAYGDW
jgi:hypothetical protein